MNAIKYTEGENKKVIVSAYDSEKGKVLEVKDRGVGIPTGMGLYLVSKVCKKLGHQIEIESKPGEGTSVRIIFTG